MCLYNFFIKGPIQIKSLLLVESYFFSSFLLSHEFFRTLIRIRNTDQKESWPVPILKMHLINLSPCCVHKLNIFARLGPRPSRRRRRADRGGGSGAGGWDDGGGGGCGRSDHRRHLLPSLAEADQSPFLYIQQPQQAALSLWKLHTKNILKQTLLRFSTFYIYLE